MARAEDGIYYVEDVVRGQWSAGKRDAMILQTAKADRERYGRVEVWFEMEPGSGGMESGEAKVKLLAGFLVHTERVTGSKEVRAEPLAAQCEGGNVRLVRGRWNADYLDELCTFPEGGYKDQVDASSGAFNKLAKPMQKLWFRLDGETITNDRHQDDERKQREDEIRRLIASGAKRRPTAVYPDGKLFYDLTGGRAPLPTGAVPWKE
jgi:predicted phage terminase large subunit-like protein